MSTISITEYNLRQKFVDEYAKLPDYVLFCEVPVFSRSVDLVMQNLNDNSITAIEFKVHDWKRAIYQAQSVALCFDHLIICLPRPKTDKSCQNIINTCKENGVGLYFYIMQEQTFEQAVPSPYVPTVWAAQKKQIVDYLEGRRNE